MNTINYNVVAFFLAATLMLGYLGFQFRKIKKQPMSYFGTGLIFVSLAFAIWLYIVAAHPENIKLIVSLGILPLAASFILFLLAATADVKAKYRVPLYIINGAILASFVLLRFFVYDSNPGFTANGYFAFNVDPVVIYFYALVTAFNLIPAIYVIGRHIKQDLLRIAFELGFTLVAVGLVVMVSSQQESLQFVNGVGIAVGLLVATVAVARYRLSDNLK
jgi:hypothetical protein